MNALPLNPSGLNASSINADEIDGGGVNFVVSPEFFDAFTSFLPVVITSDLDGLFDIDCPHVVIQGWERTVDILPGISTIVIRGY